MTMPEMKYYLISNDCMAGFIYQYEYYPDTDPLFIMYPSPFIASSVPNNENYVRFCEGYDRYISMEPVFGEPVITTRDILRRGDGIAHPVMFLGDIEIHWTHDTDSSLVLKKFKGRLEISRKLEPVFIWCDLAFDDKYTGDERLALVTRFCSIPHKKIYLTKYPDEAREEENTIVKFVPEWEGKTDFDRAYRYNRRPMFCKTFKECIDKLK